ncbi:MAG: TatD family hydrolase [Bacteroidales bacterium]
MIDSHCHLADAAFEEDLEAVVARAHSAGVSDGLCVLAMDEVSEHARLPRIAAAWPALRFAVGIHPHQAGAFAGRVAGSVEAVKRLLVDTPGMRAVGEIGLDYHYDLAPRDVQREVFAAQVQMAGEMHRPVVVHTREAEEDTQAIMGRASELSGVLHCFTGSAAMADWAIEKGLYISFAGVVTFANAAALREVAARVPLDRMLVETDCPYLAPVPHRGRRNEPAYVVETARTVAELKGVAIEAFDRAMNENFRRLFRP